MNENNHGDRYSYSFRPAGEMIVYNEAEQTQHKKKKRFSIQIAAFALVCTLLGTTGGFLGALYVVDNAAENTHQQETAQPSGNNSAYGTIESRGEDLSIVSTASTAPLTLQEIYSKSNPAVVAISTETIGRNAFGQTVSLPAAGSGFLISSDGYIVTNNHVISGATTINVQMCDEKTYQAEVVGTDSYTDLAVLKIDAKNLSYLTFGVSGEVYVGDLIAAIGNPLGELANTFTVGYISALHREINIDGIPRTMLQMDAAVNSGNSGGPLIDQYGQVIGVVAAKSSGSGVEGLGFAIPSDVASDIISQLINYGYVKGRPYLGVTLGNSIYGYNQSAVYVDGVFENGPADGAGLKQGDYILEANGEKIYTRDELLGILYQFKVGDKISLKIQRDRDTSTVEVTLGEYVK